MTEHSSDQQRQFALNRLKSADYAGHIQEAMRYNRLSSQEYNIVIALMRAVTQGQSQDEWEKELNRTVSVMKNQEPDQKLPHADEPNRYVQMIEHLRDIELWPWGKEEPAAESTSAE